MAVSRTSVESTTLIACLVTGILVASTCFVASRWFQGRTFLGGEYTIDENSVGGSLVRFSKKVIVGENKEQEVNEGQGDVPENAPLGCPGIQSTSAGKNSACAGCPNQQLCATGQTTESDSVIFEIAENLSQITHKVLVLSGKGGVGKSTIAAQVAWALESRGLRVGLLDIDICGPSIPQMTGTSNANVRMVGEGWVPVAVTDRLSVMSIGYLLPDQDGAVIWRGPKKNGLIRQFLTDVCWGKLDYLIIDTPPGTSDEHLSIVSYLKASNIDGAIIVTTPAEVALADVRKEISFCKTASVKVLGVVENMANSVYTVVNPGGTRKMCERMNVPYGGFLTFHKDVVIAGESGFSVPETSPISAEISSILDNCLTI